MTTPTAQNSQPPTYEGRVLPHPGEPVFDQGLGFDVETITRRRILQALGFGAISAGMFTIAGCSPGATAVPGSTTSPGSTTGSTAVTGASCAVIPEETAGPFPGDGTNGPDVLTESGVVRQDITSSFGSSTTKAEGVPLKIRLQIVDATSCLPIPSAAVYLWHCDKDGGYSMYGQGIQDENYLRGVQVAGEDGNVTFSSIFPGCYSGRWPHVHFEVYGSLADATDASKIIATSQIAMPADACEEAYGNAGYEASVANLARISLASDNVFRDDGGVHQLGTMSGSIGATDSMVTLQVPVKR